MTNILLIANDQRVLMIVNHFQPLLESMIFAAADINKGLKEFFDKRPVMVFIQEELAGTNGEAVAKHIKTLLRQESPRLVLLRNSSGHYLLSQSSFDDFIPLQIPESELLEKFEEQLRKIPLIQWNKQVSVEAETSAAAPDLHAEMPACRADLPAEISFSQESSFSLSAEMYDIPDDGEVPVPRENPERTPDAKTVFGEPFVLPGFLEESRAQRRGKKRWLFGGGIAMVLLVGLVLHYHGPGAYSKGDRSPVKAAGFEKSPLPERPSAAERLPARTVGLPSVILRGTRDTGYDGAHPGWARYCTDETEFLVFRENGAVRAIQVIALGQKPISADFYASFSREVCGSDLWSIRSRKERDGFVVEEGTFGVDKAEVLIYRKKPSGEIRAFVLSFS